MSVAGVNDATKRWKEWCDNVQAQTTVNRAESEADNAYLQDLTLPYVT